MPNTNMAHSSDSNRVGSKKRRPAGISRREKHRRLQIETLESRQMMTATPISYDYDQADELKRGILLDAASIRALENASDLSQYTEAELAKVTQWVVFTELGTNLDPYATEGGFSVTSETGIVPGSYIVTVGQGGHDGIISALSGDNSIDFFYPLVEVGLQEMAITNDELLERQWHLVNFGQEVGNPNFGFLFGVVGEDINVQGAWDQFTGNGVVIGIVDTGVDLLHPDLIDNLRPDLGINLTGLGTNLNPSINPIDAHGTAVAGLAAGVGNNGIGITGVAYNAEIAPIRLFVNGGFAIPDPAQNDLLIAQAFLHQSQEIDIYNHSWGLVPPANDQGVIENPRAIVDFEPLSMLAVRNSVFFGRGGLGSIHVVASGNDAGTREGGNNSGMVNSRYTIAVGGVVHDGTAAAYAQAGAAVLIVAPTGSNPESIIRDDELGSGLTTTDVQGELGYNESGFIDADYLEDIDYSSRFNGTSAAAPLVSGVIALMLEANPDLTYRDIQHILVRSARQNNPLDASWITNVNDFFADPLAYDADSILPEEEQDKVFSGNWPFPVLGDPDAEVPLPDRLVYYQETRVPYQFTNGAGFAVSQMTTNTEYGYAHGVVDATLAVELAKNWVTLGGQQSEYTYSTGIIAGPIIKSAAISSEETGERRVPGGLNPRGDGPVDQPNAFIDFFNEFGVEDDPTLPEDPEEPAEGEEPEEPEGEGPFSGEEPPVNTRDAGGASFGQVGIPITGIPSMEVEWIEVEVNLNGDENAFDFLRIALVSPDGTVSELKPYDLPNADNTIVQNILFDPVGDPVGVLDPDSGGLNAVFTTNRHWGERTEGKPRLNSDGTPVRAFDPDTGLYDGDAIVDGWRLVFENFGENELDIGSYTIAFHGVNTEGTGRIQGTVGVDDDGDGLFSATLNEDLEPVSNFTRFVEQEIRDIGEDDIPNTDDDLDFTHFGDGSRQFDRVANFNQESWAQGVVVYADLNHNGARDATDPHYQIGSDGNYYFDLPAGFDYDIRIDVNSLEDAGLYNQQNVDLVAGVLATATITEAGERVLATPVEGGTATGTYGPLFGGFRFPIFAGTTTSVPELNIMLVANAQPENVVDLSGSVYADLNGNGVRDGDDAPIAGADVFIDINQNGVFTPGFDILATTDSDGNYQFIDPVTGEDLLQVAPGFYNVRVLEGTTGTFGEAVNPEDARYGFFFAPELVRDDLDFGFTFGGAGGGNTGSVAISGVVFEDINETGTRQASEPGLNGSVAKVYIDQNGNNQFDDGTEVSTNLSPNGSFVFNSLNPGTYTVRIEFDPIQYRQTTPQGDDEDDREITVTIAAGGAETGLLFGLKNNAEADWGDLPNQYGATTLAQNGARHIYDGNMFLGSSVDQELNGTASANANFDDNNGIGDDENGVAFSTLFDDSTSMTLTVTASTNGGWLQGWFDWNENGIFEASEKAVSNILLSEGENIITIDVPTALLTDDTVFVRFRYGEEGINSIFGEAQKGEVEDYAISVVSTAIDPGVRIVHGADFNEDGFVNGRDFMIWQRGFGITTGATAAQGDADSDGDVDNDDLDMWRDEFGTVIESVSAVTANDFDPFAAARALRQNYLKPLVPLVPNQVGTNAGTGTVVASAQSSTFGGLNLAMLSAVASKVDALFDLPTQVADSTENVDTADIDAAFDASDDSLTLPAIGGDEEIAPPFVAGEDADSDEDAAFESAFAEVNWLLI